MKTILRMLTVLLLVSWTINASAQVTVTQSFVNNSAFEVFFLKDFDINSPSSGPPVFLLQIRNSDPEAAHEIILCLELHSRKHGPLSRGETNPFTVQPRLSGLTTAPQETLRVAATR